MSSQSLVGARPSAGSTSTHNPARRQIEAPGC